MLGWQSLIPVISLAVVVAMTSVMVHASGRADAGVTKVGVGVPRVVPAYCSGMTLPGSSSTNIVGSR
jgi:hypothetical protein